MHSASVADPVFSNFDALQADPAAGFSDLSAGIDRAGTLTCSGDVYA